MAERWILNAGTAAPLVLPNANRQGVCRVTKASTPPPSSRLSEAPVPEGAHPVAREWENRVVTLDLTLERPEDPWAGVSHDFGAGSPVEAEGDGTVPGFAGTVRRVDADGNALYPAVQDLQLHLGQLATSGESVCGTLTRVMETGERIVFDITSVSDNGATWGESMWLTHETATTIEFRCLPFGRSPEVHIGAASRTAGKRWVTVTGTVPGDVDAQARIELSGATRNAASVLYAVDQITTQPAEYACSALDRPAAATLVTAAGSVAAQVVQRPAFTLGGAGLWEAGVMLSDGGVPLVRPGRWRIMLRVRGQSGGRVRLRWTAGSRVSGMTVCTPVTLTSDQWELVSLGVVSIPAGAGLDGVIETLLPHTQPIQYDQLLFVAADTSGEQHATVSTLPAELLALDRWAGSGNVTGSTADLGGVWTTSGTGTSATRSGSAAIRVGAYSTSTGVAHGLAIGSPAAVRTTAALSADGGSSSSATGGDAGIWVGNAAGQAAIAGSSGATGTAGSGAAGAWGVYLGAWIPPGSGMRYAKWRLLVVDGTVVSTLPSSGGGGAGVLELTVADGVATASVTNGAGYVMWTTSMDVPALPSSLRAGIATHGWDGYSGPLSAWSEFSAFAVPVAGDAALFATKSARHETNVATRVDSAGIRGPVTPWGARPRLQASGPAGRPTRVAVMATRGNLRNQVDAAAADPLTVNVYATPRWFQIPGATS